MSLLVKGRCVHWHRYTKVHQLGGDYRLASTLSSCKYTCILDIRCTAIDWHGKKNWCWHHFPWSTD